MFYILFVCICLKGFVVYGNQFLIFCRDFDAELLCLSALNRTEQAFLSLDNLYIIQLMEKQIHWTCMPNTDSADYLMHSDYLDNMLNRTNRTWFICLMFLVIRHV